MAQADERWGEVPAAFVVWQGQETTSDGFSPILDGPQRQNLDEFCRSHLAGFKVPKAYYAMSALPKSATGKIQKRELRDMLSRRNSAASRSAGSSAVGGAPVGAGGGVRAFSTTQFFGRRELRGGECRAFSSSTVSTKVVGSKVIVARPTPGVTHLKLNSPGNRNALCTEMLANLLKVLENDLEETKVVVLSGAGPVFCAGHDLKQIKSLFPLASPHERKAEFEKLFKLCSDVMVALADVPQVVVAQTHGWATAAGCQLASTCDLVVSTASCRFATPGVNIGLFCSTPSVALLRSTKAKKFAHLMLYSGEPVTAEQGLAAGLVSRIIRDDATTPGGVASGEDPGFDFSTGELHPETLALASSIAAKSAAALRIGKRALRADGETGELASAYSRASAAMVENLMLPDAEEGISAFLEKRTPEWK